MHKFVASLLFQVCSIDAYWLTVPEPVNLSLKPHCAPCPSPILQICNILLYCTVGIHGVSYVTLHKLVLALVRKGVEQGAFLLVHGVQ